VSSAHWSSSLPYHRLLYLTCHQYRCATCHPCSGDMCHSLIGPPVTSTSQSTSVHGSTTYSTMYPATSVIRLYDLYNHLPRGIVRTVQTTHSTSFFLPVWTNEQIMICGVYNVCFIPFKLCCVCNIEAYAHVYFESIMRTLIFRHF
jgi:hypothetical protein